MPEKDIAASMHHASRATALRYLQSDRKAMGAAIAALPDLDYSQGQKAVATGIDGKVTDPGSRSSLRKHCATGAILVDTPGRFAKRRKRGICRKKPGISRFLAKT